jgi:type IV secretory pathway component VirB8
MGDRHIARSLTVFENKRQHRENVDKKFIHAPNWIRTHEHSLRAALDRALMIGIVAIIIIIIIIVITFFIIIIIVITKS